MALNTLEKLYLALRDLQPRIEIEEGLRLQAKKSLDRMLEMAGGTVGQGGFGGADVIPDYQTLMEPSCDLRSTRKSRLVTSSKRLADSFNLTEDERAEQIPSGGQAIFYNRIHWAKTYLKQAGLIEYTRRGHFRDQRTG